MQIALISQPRLSQSDRCHVTSSPINVKRFWALIAGFTGAK
jgi:hypothetical protein